MGPAVNPGVFAAIVVAGAVVGFVGLWFIVTTLLATISGWTDLAATFPAASRPSGQTLRRLVLKVGAIGEKGATTLVPTPDGLYLESHPLFRFRRPAVFLPWNRIRFVELHRMLWQRSATLDLGGVTTMRVRDAVFPILRAHGINIPKDKD